MPIKKRKFCKECDGSGEGENFWTNPGYTYPPCIACDGTGFALSTKEKWQKAADFVMPFGKFKNRSLDNIASSDEGLKWLAWLHNARKEEGRCSQVDTMLKRYLSDKTIQKELEAIK